MTVIGHEAKPHFKLILFRGGIAQNNCLYWIKTLPENNLTSNIVFLFQLYIVYNNL